MKMNLRRFGALAISVVALNACDLEVTNPNDPETERVLGTPQDVESLLGSYYRRWHAGLYEEIGIWPMAAVMSFENYSSLANFCQNARAPVPTPAVNANFVGNACDGDQSQPYFQMGEVVRVASNIVAQIEGGLEFASDAQKERNLAFAEFLRGVSMGYTALFYDSSAVIVAGQDPEDAGELRGHAEVMDSALAALQRAIDHANAAGTASGGFPLPSNWIPSPTTFTQAEFVRLVRSYRARLRANVARTPAERAAVDWAAVIQDSQNGITADHVNTTDNDLGPYHDWVTFINPGGDTWHQMPPFFVGMGDVSGSYAAWINQPISARGAGNVGFFMITPDQRFPQGNTRAEQRADFAISSCESPGVPCKRYFVNRDAGDQFSGLSWGWSNYDFERFHPWAEVGDAGSPTDGNIPFFTKAELDMLEAEGHIRQGNLVSAAALINKTRTAAPDPVTGAATGGGLPAVLAVPGSAATGTMPNCVPKTPQNAGNGGGGTVICGDIMEALKWEKRLETLMTHFAAWYLDARGWGDLAQGVPLFWATPYEDLLARNITNLYGAGAGVGTAPNSAAAVSGYGW